MADDADELRDDPSETQLANRALSRLGARRIASLDEGTTEAEAARTHYFDVRDELLEKYNWDFAILNVVLAADPTPPLFNRAAKYALPSDFLRLLRPFPEANTLAFDWLIQSGFIYTNYSEPLNLRYVARITDVTRFSPSFRKVLTIDLAIAMCEDVTQSNKKKEGLREELKIAIAEAKQIKAIQQPPQTAPVDDWLISRDSGLGPGPESGFEGF